MSCISRKLSITFHSLTVSLAACSIVVLPCVGNATESTDKVAKEVRITSNELIWVAPSYEPNFRRTINPTCAARAFQISPGEHMDFYYGDPDPDRYVRFATLDFNWFKIACKNGWPSGAQVQSSRVQGRRTRTIIPFCNPKSIYEVTVFNISSRYLSNLSCEVGNPNSELCSVSRANLSPGESATVSLDMAQYSQALIKWVNDSGRPFQVNIDLDPNNLYSFLLRPANGSQYQVAVSQMEGSPFFWKVTFTQTGADPD